MSLGLQRSALSLVLAGIPCFACAASSPSSEVPTTSTGIHTGPVVNPANGHTYYLLDQSSWSAAEARAVRLGGHLATINDIAENTWIFDTFGGATRNLWIGLNDRDVEGTFVWSSGEAPAFVNWDAGQPDNWTGLGPGGEDYVHLFRNGWHTAQKWNELADVDNFQGSQPMFGVVEVPSSSNAPK